MPLEMYTVSSSDDSTAIVYDENTILSSFYLFETPSYSIDVSMKFSDPTNSAVLSYIHNIYIGNDDNEKYSMLTNVLILEYLL